MDQPVLIVGAGPTGLVLALWLTKLGVKVRIVDKTQGPGTTSRALAVQARTLEFYRQVLLYNAVVEGGRRVGAVNFWARGVQAVHLPLQNIGEGLSPFPSVLVYPQDAHERHLIDRHDSLGVKVERQTELLRFDQDDQRVRAILKKPDGSEETCECAYLAGCDGARSTVRETLGAQFPGGTYTGMFYVADVDATGPAANGEIHVDFEDADFIAVFPLKQDGRLRLVGPIQWDTEKAGREPTFEDVGGRAIRNLHLTVSRVNWFSTYRVHHRVADRFRDRRAFLLGDAAHIHSPVGGQGMNTGIGDAINLAWKLAAVLQRGAGDALLSTYESERIVFARRLVATTDRVFTLVTRPGTLARWARTRLFPLAARLLFKLSSFRRRLFRAVSQIDISYHESPLSEGQTGSVRGGDRLPWFQLSPGQDNFAPLASLSWQVHLYGDAPAGLAQACADLHLPLHVFPWQPEMSRTGLVRNALYLLRPDGYIALADPNANPQHLRDYLTSRESRGLHGAF